MGGLHALRNCFTSRLPNDRIRVVCVGLDALGNGRLLVLRLALLTVMSCVVVLGAARAARVRGIRRAGGDGSLFATRNAS